MFEIGFTELLLIAVVALVVLGPERLPGAVRTVGLWAGRIKRSFGAIKAEVEREIGADEIRRQLHNENILEMEREMKRSIEQAKTAIEPPATPDASTPPPTTAAQDDVPRPPAVDQDNKPQP